MKFGVTKEQPLDGSPAIIEELRKGVVVKRLKQYREEKWVANSTEETAAYLKFAEKVAKLRDENRLGTVKYDESTLPTMQYKFPKTNIDGSYFIIFNWTEIT